MRRFYIESLISSRKLAITEDGMLTKLLIDENYVDKNLLPHSKSIIKNIYRGRVKRVGKDLASIFVEIEKGVEGYLQIDTKKNHSTKLKVGDRVMVQVVKDAKDGKKAVLTMDISLSSRNLVYLPHNTRNVVSSKLEKKYRSSLKEIMDDIVCDENIEGGFILRSRSGEIDKHYLKKEAIFLNNEYRRLYDVYLNTYDIGIIHRAKSRIYEYIEDNFDNEIDEIHINRNTDEDLRDIIRNINPEYLFKIVDHKGGDVFGENGISVKIDEILKRKIDLDGGASIIIDKTEAMTVIDVNSGGAINSLRGDSHYLVNIMAAEEISRIIMARDISGIIIVDFINMDDKNKYISIVDKMKESMKNDDRKVNIHGFTKLGLLEMSRRRSSDSIDSYYNEAGRKSTAYILEEIEKDVYNEIKHRGKTRFEYSIEEEVIMDIRKKYPNVIQAIESKYSVEIELHRVKSINRF